MFTANQEDGTDHTDSKTICAVVIIGKMYFYDVAYTCLRNGCHRAEPGSIGKLIHV